MKLIEINKNVNWITIDDCTPNGLDFEASSIEGADLPKHITWDDFWKNISSGPEGAWDHKEVFFSKERSIKDEDIFLRVGKFGIPICPKCKIEEPCDGGNNDEMYSDASQCIWSCPKCNTDYDILEGELK